ncbi:methyl-accepting chemotaxis protein [Nitrosomonas sp. Nm51]|uniref:methyl-accepting chemotaxis protein n=1 Tax=Nitrosomonas sp. Nm51 TaxID=133720 RepID=UPI0008D33440|nr:methyl-accepting chemotaxis protein [Nitrosomonas sp. Nm51]SER00812.1 methyl-accepting chemotaxis protein [Nitrosomonas sp. Nm51]
MNWSLKKTYIIVGIIIILLAVVTIGSSIMSLYYSRLSDEAANRRYQSYLLADELRQSSDDLTRLARTYVVSGETKWEDQYLEILNIRNGKQARPKNYERIYWDFRAAGMDSIRSDGETVALLDLMEQMGFSEAELDKLAEAQANSDNLVRTETIAMNMVKGLYVDSQGNFTQTAEPDMEKAREMMHDLTYHQNKADIMKFIDEFFVMLDERTAQELAAVKATREQWLGVATFATGLAVVFVLLTLFFVQHRTSKLFVKVGAIGMRIADGDLSRPVDAPDRSEEGKLLKMMNDMQTKLANIIGAIRGNADSVAAVSKQIAHSNLDLSQRNELQASALEEMAASMEEFSSSLDQNADSVRNVSQLATKASKIAIEGGEAVGQVVNTMQNISESSQKITDIINVIDSIAFQTNILALNAAVEAARAGEQGRGFAVVASEVRNLAQHSAGAAKEIKRLITVSVERVEQGSVQVDQARNTMKEIVNSIRHVSDLMKKIDHATSEQQSGISQVNLAITQIDESTQTNSALVEQTAAAAENLEDQAAQLVQTIARFKLKCESRESALVSVLPASEHSSTRLPSDDTQQRAA